LLMKSRVESSQLQLKRRRAGFDDAKLVGRGKSRCRCRVELSDQILLRIATPFNVRLSGCYLHLLR
jgi:hypothetical protein